MKFQIQLNAFLFACALVCTASVSVSAAVPVDQLRFEALSFAKNGEQARKIDGTSFDLSVARAECEAQMESRLVPFACFTSHVLEAELAQKKIELPPLYLEEGCATAAKRADASMLDGLRDGLHLLAKSVSLTCAKAVRDRISEIEYILSKKDPSALARDRE